MYQLEDECSTDCLAKVLVGRDTEAKVEANSLANLLHSAYLQYCLVLRNCSAASTDGLRRLRTGSHGIPLEILGLGSLRQIGLLVVTAQAISDETQRGERP